MPIDKQLIRSILINRKEIIQQLTFVPRSIAIEDATPTILVGVRRSGKSYLLYQKMFELASNGHSWDEFLYINFEYKIKILSITNLLLIMKSIFTSEYSNYFIKFLVFI